MIAAPVSEDSSAGYIKGKKIGGNIVIVEWLENSKICQALLLIRGRFIVDIEVRISRKPDEAEAIAAKMNLSGLTKIKPEATSNLTRSFFYLSILYWPPRLFQTTDHFGRRRRRRI